MDIKNSQKKDTTTIKYLDSSTVIQKGNEHIILIQDYKKEITKEWYESSWITSLIIPILVAAFVAWFTNRLNTTKNDVEIEKLKEETQNLKKTFQPIVIGTLQSIQEKIITSKIDALKKLVQIRNDFSYHEQQYCEGDPITPDYDEYLELLFRNFAPSDYDSYNSFHDTYSYLFPDNVFHLLTELQGKISNLNETKKSFLSMGDPYLELDERDGKYIEEILNLFKNSIQAIRKDCHLDTTFIHDFIDENKT